MALTMQIAERFPAGGRPVFGVDLASRLYGDPRCIAKQTIMMRAVSLAYVAIRWLDPNKSNIVSEEGFGPSACHPGIKRQMMRASMLICDEAHREVEATLIVRVFPPA
jgi:hypothetical protein